MEKKQSAYPSYIRGIPYNQYMKAYKDSYRKKKKRIQFYVSIEEYAIILSKAGGKKKILSDFCKLILLSGKIKQLTKEQESIFKEIVYQIQKIGTNINQISKAINIQMLENRQPDRLDSDHIFGILYKFLKELEKRLNEKIKLL